MTDSPPPNPFSKESLLRAANAASLEGFWLFEMALLEIYAKLHGPIPKRP